MCACYLLIEVAHSITHHKENNMVSFTKCMLELVNLFFNNSLAFYIAKKLGLFQAVFVMYPANHMFADHYTYRFRQKRITWKPFIIGVLQHPDNRRTLTFAVSATEADILSTSAASNLREMFARTEEIKKRLGADSEHLAGIIPGVLTHLRTRRCNNEQIATATNVTKAVCDLRNLLGHIGSQEVFLLGHKGYIGKEVTRLLTLAQVSVIGIDLGDMFIAPEYPHMVLNITRPEVLNGYIPVLNTYSVVVNEVYPAPHRDVVQEIQARGAVVYHIAGVAARSIPPFPFSYGGAVPCCAAIKEVNYAPVVVQL